MSDTDRICNAEKFFQWLVSDGLERWVKEVSWLQSSREALMKASAKTVAEEWGGRDRDQRQRHGGMT